MNTKRQRTFLQWLLGALLIGLGSIIVYGQVVAQGQNLIKNGSFEEGFVEGLGVANDWGYFHSGNAEASFYDDSWELVVADGEHAQLIELTNATSTDSYAGIYQNVDVTPDQSYKLTFKGLVRSQEGSIEASNYGYRMQYAVDLTGNEDWQEVVHWVELPWDEQPREGPESGAGFVIHSEEKTFTATGDSVTVFLRAWKKWAGSGEGNYDIDAIRLVAMEGEEAEEPAEPLPETGANAQAAGNSNLIWLAASAVVILLLIGSAFLRQRRRTSGH